MPQQMKSILLFTTLLITACTPRLELKVKVLDDSGTVATGATVYASTFKRNIPGDNFGRDEHTIKTAITDSNGWANILIRSKTGKISYRAQLEDKGYYGETYTIVLNISDYPAWKTTSMVSTAIVPRVTHPIPLYAKRVNITLAEEAYLNTKPIGYDLLVGDIVEPFGIGIHSDMEFVMESSFNGMTSSGFPIVDATLVVRFPGQGNGIQSYRVNRFQSPSLRLPRIAPESFYNNSITQSFVQTEKTFHRDWNEEQNYYIKTRSEVTSNGLLTNSLYGKMHGDFNWSPKGEIQFTYYINPNHNDRNVEFNLTNNLFTNLVALEGVNEP